MSIVWQPGKASTQSDPACTKPSLRKPAHQWFRDKNALHRPPNVHERGESLHAAAVTSMQRDLVEQARHGDADAFTQLVRATNNVQTA